MKPINTSTYDFPTLIGDGFVYVDKTAQIYELARRGTDGIYFFPRPRRFGKSLLLSTLKALFQGRRELFKGLAIENTDWNWDKEVYPVLHLDMSVVADDDPAVFEQNLNNLMRNQCRSFGIDFDPSLNSATNFENLLIGLREKSPNGRYVLLIDEYDAPIAGMLDTPERREQLEEIRRALHEFYVKAKAHCCDMRFLMVTGVSKFAKTSIFSAFNNPVDLSLDARAADLVGYTHEEMEKYFHEHIQTFADARGKTYAQAKDDLLTWYDSYQFSPERLVKVVNPVSFGRALVNRAIRNYWEATAGSTLILDALKARDLAPIDLEGPVAVCDLDSPGALTAPAEALLFQSGYLTIEKPIDDLRIAARIPNNEVRLSLERGYVHTLLGTGFDANKLEFAACDSAEAIAQEGVGERFAQLIRNAYAQLPHDWVCKDEREAKRYFLSFMVFARAEVVCEAQHATGRPDAVLKTAKGIYIFEFKYNQSAESALKQCRERNYGAKFAEAGLPIYYVGVNYNPADNVRTVDDIRCEEAGGRCTERK